MARAVLLLPVLAALAGCSATRPLASAAPADDALRTARVQRIGHELAGASAAAARIDVGLASRDGLGAWSWPDGRIRVSRALVDVLDDDQLHAALAHEIGHLLDAGHVAGEASALAGSGDGTRRDPSGIETRADALACGLLRAHGTPLDALPRMLRTVASHLTSDDDGPDPAQLLARARVAERTCTTAR